MESSADYKQILLLPPNPNTRRGFRVSWTASPDHTYLAYATQNNVVFRNLNNLQESYVYTDFSSKVTSVRFSPNSQYIAAGNDKGQVKLFSLNKETKEFVVKKEHTMLSGAVQTIAWTDDGQRMSAGGEGKDMFAKAVLAESGTKIGDLFGPTKTVMTMDIKQKPYRLIMSGENYEIYVFDGVPFKHNKTLHHHQNFVNRLSYRPDGTQFVSVSSDKSIILHDTETLEPLKKIEKAHNKGIMDVAWIDDQTVITCSTDNTVKIWNLDQGVEVKTLSLSEDLTEKVENQQLGLIQTADNFFTISLNSNINIWKAQGVHDNTQLTPSQIIQGHSNYLSCLKYVNGTLISSDQDGKLFSWSTDFYASLFKGDPHTANVTHLASYQNLVFSGSVDGTVKKSESNSDNQFEFKASLKLDGFPVAMSTGSNKVLYVLQNNNQIAVIETEGFTVVQNFELKEYEGTALTYSESTNELWVGDKKGVIHVLDASDLSTQKSIIEKKHNHAVSYMTTSKDGKLIASGDAYRYMYVFNTETQAEAGCFTYHTSKIIHIDFNHDSTKLLTSGLDLSVGVANLTDKSKKVLHRTNEKELSCAVFDNEDRFFTAGYDCSIRLWSK